MEKIINYNWEEMIIAIITGIKNFVEKFEFYMPKTKYNFEDPATYKFDEE